MLKWKVVFQDQEMNHEQHVALSRQFGDPTPGHVVFGTSGIPGNLFHREVSQSQLERGLCHRPWSGWHTDITAAINPPWASILRGVTVPPYGGDTFWTNLAAVYEALSKPKAWLDTLHGEHAYEPLTGSTDSKDYDEVVSKNKLVSVHPLVRVHPETGEKVLYVSPSFLRRIPDLSPQESHHVLEMLWEHSVLPEYTIRFK